MRWLSIIFGLVTLVIFAGSVLSLVQAIPQLPTPAEAVSATGKIFVTKIDLRGSSFAVFDSPSFQDDKIKVGHYNSSPTLINDTKSKSERPGIQASLMDWLSKPEINKLGVNTPDKTTPKYINKISPKSKPLSSYTPPPVIQMTPPAKK
jgi:hypothetical protein